MPHTHTSALAHTEPGWAAVSKTRLPRAAFAAQGHAKLVSTWKFPHHWVKGGALGALDAQGKYLTGTMYLHAGGLAAAWAAANGARSGEQAPEAVLAHLRAHRRAIGIHQEAFVRDVRAEAQLIAGRILARIRMSIGKEGTS